MEVPISGVPHFEAPKILSSINSIKIMKNPIFQVLHFGAP